MMKVTDNLTLEWLFLCTSDMEEYANLILDNKPHLTMFDWVETATRESILDYYKKIKNQNNDFWLIKLDSKIIGAVEIRFIKYDWNTPHKELGYWLAYDYRNQGIMKKVLDRIFNKFKSGHCYLSKVKKDNIPGINLCKSLGMEETEQTETMIHFRIKSK